MTVWCLAVKPTPEIVQVIRLLDNNDVIIDSLTTDYEIPIYS